MFDFLKLELETQVGNCDKCNAAQIPREKTNIERAKYNNAKNHKAQQIVKDDVFNVQYISVEEQVVVVLIKSLGRN